MFAHRRLLARIALAVASPLVVAASMPSATVTVLPAVIVNSAYVEGSAPIYSFVCNATIVEGETLLTAAHCLHKDAQVIVGGNDICSAEGWLGLTVVSEPLVESHDVATFEVEGAKGLVADQSMVTGPGELVSVGFQQSARLSPMQCTPTEARLSNCSLGATELRCQSVGSTTICSGLSGAGVYSIRDGELVGVVSSSIGCQDAKAVVALKP